MADAAAAKKPRVLLDKKLFADNIEKFCKHFKANPALYGNATALSIDYGGATPVDQDNVAPSLSAAFQLYLLTYEFPDTISVVTTASITFLTSSKKLAYLEPIVAECNGRGAVRATALGRSGSDDADFAKLLAIIADSGAGAEAKLGRVEGGVASSAFMTAWRAKLAASDIKPVDPSRGIDNAFAVKSKAELSNIQTAAKMTSRLYRKVMLATIENVMENDKKVTHASVGEKMEKALENLEKYGIKVDQSLCMYVLPPVVQSGGKYNIDLWNVKSNTDELKFDTIVTSVAGRFKSYGAAVARTYFVNPSSKQSKAYQALLDIQQWVIDALKPGEKISSVVRRVKDKIDAKASSFVDGFVAGLSPTFGAGIGLMAKESSLELREGNDTIVRVGMVFNVCVGVKDLVFSDSTNPTQQVAMLLADTVEIVDGDVMNVTTADVVKELREIAFTIENEDDDEEDASEGSDDDGDKKKKKKKDKKKERDAPNGGAGGESGLGRDGFRSARLAAANSGGPSETEAKQRDELVRELLRNTAQDMLKFISSGTGTAAPGQVKEAKPIDAYKDTADFPPELRPNQIYVDRKAEAVLVPIAGMHVPFHISTVKAVSKTEEGPLTYLRLTFYAPGASHGKDVPPSMLAAMNANPDAMYIRMINVKSKDPKNINTQLRLIKDMQKRMRDAQEEERVTADVVKQAELHVEKGVRVPVLPDVMMYPHLSGRKSEGSLEAHSNGFRFVSNKAERFDILYSNVRHAIFQPCDKEHEVLLHFHLKQPLMVGKKKAYDIQFFTEVVDASQALDNRGKSMYDPDELDEEAQERRRRGLLNKTFKKYVEQVQDIVSRAKGSFHEFDIPSRDISFSGAPTKENVLLMPCTTCLVSLTDRPPFVLTLDDIEHVHFERVHFSSKSFDMVMIMKPGTTPKGQDEFHRISAIPMNKLDTIKMWLTDVLFKGYTEGVQPLNWRQFLKDYARKPEFYTDMDADGVKKEVGWESLMNDEEGEDEEEEEEESEYSDAEDEDEESEEEDSDDDDFDSAVDDSDEDDEDEDASDEESDGADWDELERRAADDDKKRARREAEEEEEEFRKSKSKKAKKSAPPPPPSKKSKK